MRAKKELKKRIEALETQLRDLPGELSTALAAQLQGAQVQAHPGYPFHGYDQIRLGLLSDDDLAYQTTPMYPVKGNLLPLAGGGEIVLEQEATRLCGWLASHAQVRLEWSGVPHAECVTIQWYLAAARAPVRKSLGDPYRGSAFFGDAAIRLLPSGASVYVGPDARLEVVVRLTADCPSLLASIKILVTHAGATAIGGA